MGATITNFQVDVLNGTLLGDATIHPQGRYRFKQCVAHRGYVEHVREALLPWSTHLASSWEKKPNNMNGKVVDLNHWDGEYLEACYFFTRTTDHLKHLREKWYGTGKKKVPRDLKLNPRNVAYWFLDDGCNSPKKRQAYFATHSFDEDDIDFLISELKRLGIRATKQKDGTTSGNLKTAVSCKDYFSFIDLIKPHVNVDCMSYKVDYSQATRAKDGWVPKKLNYELAREIRWRYLHEKIKQKELAKEYNVSVTTIQKVINHKIYQEADVGFRGSADVVVRFNFEGNGRINTT